MRPEQLRRYPPRNNVLTPLNVYPNVQMLLALPLGSSATLSRSRTAAPKKCTAPHRTAPRACLKVLRLTGTKRMFVGHTPQRAGINSAADGQIWRLDTGMTAMIGGRPEVGESQRGAGRAKTGHAKKKTPGRRDMPGKEDR